MKSLLASQVSAVRTASSGKTKSGKAESRGRRLGGDESGVSAVVSAILVISLLVIAATTIATAWIPEYERKNEAEYVDQARDTWQTLQRMILNHENGTIEVKMGADPATIFGLFGRAAELGVLTVTPARSVMRIPPSDDAYVWSAPGGTQVSWVQNSWSGTETYPTLQSGTWTSTYDNYYRGENENNAGGELKLAKSGGVYLLNGYIESSIYDAGASVPWGIITWNADTPSTAPGENNAVDAEPTTLVDGSSRRGSTTSSYTDAQTQNGVYENIAENGTGENYMYVSSSSAVKGTITNFDAQRSATDDNAYATLSEAGAPGAVTIFYETFPNAINTWLGTGQDEIWHVITISEAGDIDINSNATESGTHPSGAPELSMEDCDDAWGVGDIVWMAKDLSGYTGVTIEYYWQQDATDAGEGFRTAYSTDATGGTDADGTWNLIEEQLNATEDTWFKKTFSLPDSACVSNFKFRFNARATGPGEESFFDDVKLTSTGTTYSMEIYENIASIPSADNYKLQMRYKLANANDSFKVQVQNSSAQWENFANLLTYGDGAWTVWENVISSDKVVSGTVRVRFVDVNPNSTAQDNLLIDYLRVKGTTTAADYKLNWEHRIKNVVKTYAGYKVYVYGYTDTGDGESVGVYIWDNNASTWEFMQNLGTTAGSNFVYTLSPISKYLRGDNISIQYFENTNDAAPTTIHIDYCAVGGENAAQQTHLTVYTRTGTDNNPYDGGWTGWSQVSNGGSIGGSSRYIQYRENLSTDNNTITPIFYDITINYTTGGGASGGWNTENLYAYSSPLENRRTYMKFDLSQLPAGVNIYEARLLLYCDIAQFPNTWAAVTGYSAIPEVLEVRGVENKTWSENTINWSNKPDYGDALTSEDWPYGSEWEIGYENMWYTFNLTSQVKSERGENMSLCIKLGGTTGEYSSLTRYVKIFSEERTYNRPHLLVTYENAGQVGEPLQLGGDNWGPVVDGGSIVFKTGTRNYTARNFIFESGSLIQDQWNRLSLLSGGLVVGRRGVGDNIDIYVNRYRVVSQLHKESSGSLKLLVGIRERTEPEYRRDNYVDNVTITVRTDYPNAWRGTHPLVEGGYFTDLAARFEGNWGELDYALEPWYGDWGDVSTRDFYGVSLTVYGLRRKPGINDINYHERVYDVEIDVVE